MDDHPKALYRQAAIHALLCDYDEAEQGYRWASNPMALNSFNPECGAELQVDPKP